MTVTKSACTSSSTVSVTVADCSTNLAAGLPAANYTSSGTPEVVYNSGTYVNPVSANSNATLRPQVKLGQATQAAAILRHVGERCQMQHFCSPRGVVTNLQHPATGTPMHRMRRGQ